MSARWAAIDPARISQCSPRHIQTVLEDAQRDILALHVERSALTTALEAMLHEFGRTYLPGSSDAVDTSRAVIAKIAGATS